MSLIDPFNYRNIIHKSHQTLYNKEVLKRRSTLYKTNKFFFNTAMGWEQRIGQGSHFSGGRK